MRQPQFVASTSVATLQASVLVEGTEQLCRVNARTKERHQDCSFFPILVLSWDMDGYHEVVLSVISCIRKWCMAEWGSHGVLGAAAANQSYLQTCGESSRAPELCHGIDDQIMEHTTGSVRHE